MTLHSRDARVTRHSRDARMTLQPGFAEPVAQAQTCFRALLDAMARPGSLHEAGVGLDPPAPLAPATAAILLTLVDAETPLWLDDAAREAWPWLAFHCGATRAEPGTAAFLCGLDMPRLAELDPGTDAGPENSATLVLQVPALGIGPSYRFSGPGLRAPTLLRLAELPQDFTLQWAANHALFPRGMDLILCAGTQLCALPRSIRVEEG